MANHPNRSKQERSKLVPATPFKVENFSERATGFRGLQIIDADGRSVCNIIFRFDDREAEMAHLICNAVNTMHESAALKAHGGGG